MCTHTHLLAVTGHGPRLAENVFDRVGVADPLLVGLRVDVRGLVLLHFSLALLSLFDLQIGSVELEPVHRRPQGCGPIYTHTNTHTCVYVSVYMCVSISIYVSVSISIYVFVYMMCVCVQYI
jgi:hypothetical protein